MILDVIQSSWCVTSSRQCSTSTEQLAIAPRLRRLTDDQPQHRRLLDRQVTLAEVAEEEQTRHRRAADERGGRAAEPREHALARTLVDVVGNVARVPRGVPPERLGPSLALLCERVAGVETCLR